jgi:hypothetical protein
MAMLAFEINKRQPLAEGRSFGATGPYEQLDGTAHFGVDPAHPDNRDIADIALAPRDPGGLVRFAADVTILTPREPERGNRRLLLDIPNRGNRLAMRFLNCAPPAIPGASIDPGDGFLMRQGYTVAWCGWQHDVPDVAGLMRVSVPEAQAADGRPVRGPLMVSFRPNAASQVQLLSDRAHRPYPAVDLDDAHAVLLEREADDAAPTTVPRDQWSFARLEAGKPVPDPRHIYLAAGFASGKLYHVVYTTSGAPVIGLGFLATRDFASFLRHEVARPENPCADQIRHAYAFGASQSGAYLRQFLYLGLNQDERERPVFDGYLIHIAGGGRGADFNQRFGQPSNTLRPRMRETPPFTDVPQIDPVTGQRGGLLDRLGTHRGQPRIFLTNSSNEYWRGDASLIHTDIEGSQDIEPSAQVRIYHYAGTQHGSATWPLTDSNPLDGSRAQCPMNTVDYRPLLRAALVRLDRWVSAEELPPPSRYPRLSDGTAVLPESTADVFSGIPGMRFPTHLPRAARNDFGPEANRGIVTALPPLPGKPYPCFVPAIDRDGNDVVGIRLPDLTVPLATHTGWNLRHPQIGASGQLLNLIGATVAFASTKKEREARGDPRPSIAERYPSRDVYLEQVRQAAQQLAEDGYLLPEDLELLVDQAAERFDVFARPSAGATS